LKKALIHRYDNEPDILAVETNGCSDVYRHVNGDDFEIVIIVPTLAARTQVAVIADAISGQYLQKRTFFCFTDFARVATMRGEPA
jgi:hypothetical protein